MRLRDLSLLTKCSGSSSMPTSAEASPWPRMAPPSSWKVTLRLLSHDVVPFSSSSSVIPLLSGEGGGDGQPPKMGQAALSPLHHKGAKQRYEAKSHKGSKRIKDDGREEKRYEKQAETREKVDTLEVRDGKGCGSFTSSPVEARNAVSFPDLRLWRLAADTAGARKSEMPCLISRVLGKPFLFIAASARRGSEPEPHDREIRSSRLLHLAPGPSLIVWVTHQPRSAP